MPPLDAPRTSWLPPPPDSPVAADAGLPPPPLTDVGDVERSDAGPPEAGPPEVEPVLPGRGRRTWLLAVVALAALALAGGLVAFFLFLTRPGADIAVTAFEVPTVVLEGDGVVVEVDLSNASGVDGTHEVVVVVDGTPGPTREAEVLGDATASVRIPVEDLAVGTHTVAIEGFEGSDVTVWVTSAPRATHPDVVAVGDEVPVEVTFTNAGTMPGEARFHVMAITEGVSRWQRQVANVSVGPGASETVTVTLPGLNDAGVYRLEVALGDANVRVGEFWVMTPPRVELPARASVTDSIDVVVPLVNESATPVRTTVALRARIGTAGPPVEATADVTIPAWGTRSVTLTLPPLADGTQTVELAVGDWTSTIGTIEVVAEAEFDVGDPNVSPDFVDLAVAPEVTVTVPITNVGGATGTHVLTVTLDGVVVEERPVELAAGERREETFVIGLANGGTHEIRVGDDVLGIEAYRLERPATGAVVFNELGGGSNRLTIVNNNAVDVFVVLTEPGGDGHGLLGVYVRAGESHTVRGIRRGLYDTYYTFGSDWCTHHERFVTGATFGRFEAPSEFVSDSTMYTTVTLTFGATDGGSPTDSVPEGEFPGR